MNTNQDERYFALANRWAATLAADDPRRFSTVVTRPNSPESRAFLDDFEKLSAAQALDRAYAEADAFHAARAPTRTVYRINWDNGADACGTFPWAYATEHEAELAAANIEAENRAQGVWDEDGYCEVIEAAEPLDPEDEDVDQMAELRKAALNRGQP